MPLLKQVSAGLGASSTRPGKGALQARRRFEHVLTLEGHAAEIWTMAMSRCVGRRRLLDRPIHRPIGSVVQCLAREGNAQSCESSLDPLSAVPLNPYSPVVLLRIDVFVTVRVYFSRGEFFVTGSNDRSIRIWSRSGAQI